MEQVRTVPLAQALEHLDNSDRVFVRLAMARGDDDRRVLRSLVVEVLPKHWLANHDQTLPGLWLKDQQVFECQNALLYRGLQKASEVSHWFANPYDCALTGFDIRPGYSTRRMGFALPKLYDQATRSSYPSYAVTPFKSLPYPYALYSISVQAAANTFNDDDPLVTEDGDDFPNFRVARAEYIYGLTDQSLAYQRDDLIAIRAVDGRGWLKEIILRPDSVAVTVAGSEVIGPGYVVLQGEGCRYKQQIFTSHATLKRPPTITDHVEIRLLCNGAVWDKAIIANPAHPYLLTSPQVSVMPGSFTEPDTVTRHPAVGTLFASVGASMLEGNGILVPQLERVEHQTSETMQLVSTPRESAPHVLRIAVVSPGDVQRERNALDAVVAELNDGIAGQLGLELKLWRWEHDSYPDVHETGAQGHIDELMRIEDADIVLGVFWTRFGSPVADAKSGTEHEVRRAYAAWKGKRSLHIMLYFNEQMRKPRDIDPRQLQAVNEFKQELMRDKFLVATYPSSLKFADLVRKNLTTLLRREYGRGN